MALNDRHSAILTQRGLDVELLVRHGVDSSEERGFSGVVIPFYEAGQVVNRKRRTIEGDKRFFQDAGARKIFWNVDAIGDASLAGQPLIITEGEFDALAALQAGFARTVSVPDGAPAEQIGSNDSTKYSYIDTAPAALMDAEATPQIILAVDNDGPGTNLMHDLALRLGKARCKWIKYPKGCKDLNDALRAHGVRGVTASLATAQWYAVPNVYRMSELPPLPDNPAYRMRMPVIGDHYRLRLGDFVVVTGIPGHGKSQWIDEIAGQMAHAYGWPAAFASFERKPQTDHRRALRTWFNRKKVIHQSRDEIAAADAWIEQMFSFIVPGEDDDVTLKWMLEKAAVAVIRHGARIVVVDPWNEMDHVRPPDMNLTEYTGFAIKEFRKFAQKYRVHMIVAAHPTKLKKLDSGEYAIPSLYDISDSAHWYNKTEVGMVVHRTASGTIVRIAKSKYHDEIGVPGDVPVHFNTDMGRYEIADTDQPPTYAPQPERKAS
jgi:twinkle protein